MKRLTKFSTTFFIWKITYWKKDITFHMITILLFPGKHMLKDTLRN